MKIWRPTACLLMGLLILVPMVGCTSMARQKLGAAVGAVAGAVLGAGVAVATGHKNEAAKYALAGAAAGGVIGYAIGKARNRRLADRDAAVREANYQRGQGFDLGITNIKAVPNVVSPGNTAEVEMRWLAIAPSTSEAVHVSANLTFRLASGEVLKTANYDLDPLANGGGIMETTIDIPIPSNCPKGSYAFDVQLSDSMNRASKSTSTPLLVS